MARKVLSATLRPNSMKHLIAELKKYRDQELPDKVTRFLNLLSAKGIDVAFACTVGTRYERYVMFTGRVDGGRKNPVKIAVVAGENSAPFVRDWISSSFQPRSAEVNSLLMLEFGSGQHAVPGWRGTFPGQQLAQLNSWYWYEYPDDTTDPNSRLVEEVGTSGLQKRESEGEIPPRPLYNAALQMQAEIERLAKIAFG